MTTVESITTVVRRVAEFWRQGLEVEGARVGYLVKERPILGNFMVRLRLAFDDRNGFEQQIYFGRDSSPEDITFEVMGAYRDLLRQCQIADEPVVCLSSRSEQQINNAIAQIETGVFPPPPPIRLPECKYFNRTSQGIHCGVHPDPQYSCEGCIDYAPHPLAEIFDLDAFATLSIERRLYSICDLLPANKQLGIDIAATTEKLMTIWVELSNLSPAQIYLVGDRSIYESAIAYLGVNEIPYFGGQALRIFFVED